MKKILVLLAAVTIAVSAFAAAPVDPAARTESMTVKLGLNERQVRKVSRLNERFADVLGEEISIGKPIYGDHNGPFYDTPGRPHPSIKPAQEEPMDPKVVEKLAKRRARYEKKLARILTAEQFTSWQKGQKPFVAR